MNKEENIQILKKIDQYIRGELSQEEIDELWKIFLQHPEYYKIFETEVHLKSLIRKGKRPNFGRESGEDTTFYPLNRYKGWILAAAAAVILAVGLQFFSLEQPETIQNLAVAEIDPSNLTGADVLRSDDGPATDTDVSINDALATAYEGDTDAAIEMFRELLDETLTVRQKASVEINLGILLYNKGEYERAKTRFLAVTEIEEIPEYQKEESWWFLGNTYLNLHQPHEARDAVFKAYSLGGRFQSAALSLLKKLDLRLGNIPPDEAPAEIGD